MKKYFYGETLGNIGQELISHGLSDGQCRELFKTVYSRGPNFIEENPQLGGRSFEYIEEHFSFSLPKISKVGLSSDKTVKFLMEMEDGLQVETVLIPFWKRYTVCLSSQVGCAMKCSFCFTGTKGLSRNLFAHEIVGQYLMAYKWLKKERNEKLKPNIVFMGQGEPLHNFEEVKKAIEVLTDGPGLHIGPKQITLSSVGHLPGLRRFQELPPINLAISLHATNNNLRDELIPLNQNYDLEKLFEVLDSFPLEGKKVINYEYLLIKGKNDTEKSADELKELLKERKAIVNLIPFNEFPDCHYQRPSEQGIEDFKKLLVKRKIRVMVRKTKGDEILAACGQLANKL